VAYDLYGIGGDDEADDIKAARLYSRAQDRLA